MLSLIIESVVFSLILIALWFGLEALLPRLSSLVKGLIRRYKRRNNHHRKRRKRVSIALGPSMPHFWR